MSHTPGPWKYEDNKIVSTTQYEPRYEEDEPTNVTVVNLLGAMGGDDVSADIRLIATAPELLEALISAYSFMVIDSQHQGRNILETMKAAIQKATQP